MKRFIIILSIFSVIILNYSSVTAFAEIPSFAEDTVSLKDTIINDVTCNTKTTDNDSCSKIICCGSGDKQSNPWSDFVEILKVTIPVVGAIITSLASTKGWQKRKKINEILREIVEAYQNSVKFFAVTQDTFAMNMSINFSERIDPKKLIDGNEVDFTLGESSAEKLPKDVFYDEFRQIESTIIDIRLSASKFISLVKLYSKDLSLADSVIEDFQKISRRNFYTWILIRNMFNSTTPKNFAENARIYQYEFTQTKKMISALENELVKLKVKYSSDGHFFT